MYGDQSLTFQEFVMAEELPLATIHTAVLEFLQGRDDAVVFGAQAVNAYVDAPRMTQDVDIMTTRGSQLSTEICEYLHQRFQIAVRIRTVANGSGHRIYQLRTEGNRNLVDVRQVANLPGCQRINDVLVVVPAELLALKVVSISARPHTPKGLTDEADSLRLLIAFPDLKQPEGPVSVALQRLNASREAHEVWQRLVRQVIVPEVDDEY